MVATAGFSASKRSRTTLPQSSDSSWRCIIGGEVCRGRILKIGDAFAYAATTSDATTKWRLRLDSARQNGLEPSLQECLIEVVVVLLSEAASSGVVMRRPVMMEHVSETVR